LEQRIALQLGRNVLALDAAAHQADDLEPRIAVIGARMGPAHVAQTHHQYLDLLGHAVLPVFLLWRGRPLSPVRDWSAGDQPGSAGSNMCARRLSTSTLARSSGSLRASASALTLSWSKSLAAVMQSLVQTSSAFTAVLIWPSSWILSKNVCHA